MDSAAFAPAANLQPGASRKNQESAAGEAKPSETNREADEKSEESQDVPVTMAAANESMAAESTASASQGSSRWSAVAVALEAEEANISLDQEMQKAYAAFVAGETASANATAFAHERAAGEFFLHRPQRKPQQRKPQQQKRNGLWRPYRVRTLRLSPKPAYAMSAEISEYGAPLAARSNTPAPDSFVAARARKRR